MARTDRRDFILDAAEHLFQRFGYRRTIVDDIAREVGIAKGSVYLHFKTKEEILLALFERDMSHLDQRLKEELSQEPVAADQLRLLIRIMTSLVEDQPVLAKMLLGDNSLELPPELSRQCCHNKDFAFGHIPGILQKGIEQGEFREDLDIQAVIPLIVSFFHIHFHNREHNWIDVEPEAFMEAMLRVLFRGILNMKGNE